MSLLLTRGSGHIPREFRKDCVFWCDPYLSAKRHQIDVGNLSSALAQSVNTFETGTSESSEVSVYSGKRGEVALDGLTLTNLLGSYGDFETDTDEDGLADGWSKRTLGDAYLSTPYRVDGYVNNYAQAINRYNTSTCWFTRTVDSLNSAHSYFVGSYVKSASVSNLFYVGMSEGGSEYLEYNPVNVNEWERAGVVVSGVNSVAISFIARVISEDIYGDGVQCIDLTEAFGAGNEPTEDWCKANIPYFSNTVSVDPQSVVSKNSDGDTMETIDLSTIGELRSLPNGTKDSVDKDGVVTRRVKEYTLTEDDIQAIGTNNLGMQIVRIDWSSDYTTPTLNTIDGTVVFDGYIEVARIYNNNTPNTFATYDAFYYNSAWTLVVSADTYADLATAKTALVGTVVRYELATPTTENSGVSLQPLMYDEGQIVLTDANDLPIPSEHKAPIFLQLLENWQNRTQEIQLGSTDGADTNDPYFDGTSLVFEGDDYLTISDDAVYDKTNAVLTLVVGRLNTTGDQYLFDKRTGASGPYIKCDAGASTISNGGGGTIYIDGVATTTLSADGSPHVVQVVGMDIQTDGAGDIKIGCDYNDANFFEGNIYFIDISGSASASYSRLVAFLTKLMAKRGITI